MSVIAWSIFPVREGRTLLRSRRRRPIRGQDDARRALTPARCTPRSDNHKQTAAASTAHSVCRASAIPRTASCRSRRHTSSRRSPVN